MVKLEMIFYKTGYTRIPRVVSITGAYKCWNNETLSFESASSEYLKKNQLLLELKEKYMSVAERWEKEWRNFSVLQWADCFKPKEEEKDPYCLCLQSGWVLPNRFNLKHRPPVKCFPFCKVACKKRCFHNKQSAPMLISSPVYSIVARRFLAKDGR